MVQVTTLCAVPFVSYDPFCKCIFSMLAIQTNCSATAAL